MNQDTKFARLSDGIKAILPQSPEAKRFGPDAARWRDRDLVACVCRQLAIPMVPLSPDAVDLMAYERHRNVFLKAKVLPLFSCEERLIMVVATDEPWSDPLLRTLRAQTDYGIIPIGASERDVMQTLGVVEGKRPNPVSQVSQTAPVVVVQQRSLWQWNLRLTGEDLVKQIVQEAYRMGASDVHLDHDQGRLSVRFRIGDYLDTMPPVPASNIGLLLQGIRVLCSFDSEQTGALSGRTSFEVESGDRLDLRVEWIKAADGPSIVLRLLDPGNIQKYFGTLPFEGRDLDLVRVNLARDSGMIVVSGPTGSGKTTTLYRMLLSLDGRRLSIRTIEDPIEYRIRGFTQIHARPEVEGFAGALRSMLRQDPDVILVGEIRDKETLDIAIRGTLTGHLLLTTLHTQNAVSVVSRMLNMGADVSALREVLSMVVAQRLCERLCPRCRLALTPDRTIAEHFKSYQMTTPATVFSKGGCEQCGHKGVIGRIPLFEIFCLDETMRDLISPRYTTVEMTELWRKTGGRFLIERGLERVAAGEVAYESVAGLEADTTRLVSS
jgi:type II secretory ATPase GspE/PulE/Tfp pilus assembly ATPase PilB-like protein